MDTKTSKIGDVIVTGYATDYVFQTIEKTGDFYEAELLKKWAPLIGSPKYILDIGANLGNHTLYWGTKLNPAQIIAIEPFEANYKLLLENIKNNRLENIWPLNVALGEKGGFVTVKHFDPDNYGGTTFAYTKANSSEKDSVQVKTADSVVSELQVPRIDFAKIDTEGFEFSVLKGMQQIIERDRPALWIEVGPETVALVYDLLCTKGYNLVEISGANTLFITAEEAQNRNISLETLLSENMALLSKVNIYYSNYEKSKKWLAAKEAKLQEREAKIFHLQKENVDLQENQKQQLQHLQEIKETEIWALKQANDRAVQVAIQQVLQESKEAEHKLEQAYETRIQQIEQLCGDKVHQAEQEKEQLIKEHTLLEEENAQLLSQIEQMRQQLQKDDATLLEEELFLQSTKQQMLLLNTKLQQAQRQNKIYEEKLNKVYGTWYGRSALKTYKVLKKIKNFVIKK